MLDERDLQAIRTVIKEESAATEARLDAKLVAVEGSLDKKLDDAQSEIMRGVAVLMEAKFSPQFNLLAEGQQAINEKLEPLDEWEDLDTRVSALEAVVKKLRREVSRLREAQ